MAHFENYEKYDMHARLILSRKNAYAASELCFQE